MKKRKRQLQQKKFITMDDNSYAQLIDDFEKGLLVLEGESLTDYIKRMGGVDYDAKANGGRVGYADGGLMSPEEYFKGKEKYMKEEQIENMRREYNEYLYKEKNGPRDEAANGGIMGYASGGGIQNLSDVYNNSSVLQDKYATQQDYLDLFDQNTTTTTTPTTSTTTTTDLIEQAPAAILPPRVNPLIIPQGGDSSDGGITNIQTPQKNFIDNIATPGVVTDSSKANQNFRNTAFHTYGAPVEEEENVLEKLLNKSLTVQAFKKGKEFFSNRSDRIVAEQKAIAEAHQEEMAKREADRIRETIRRTTPSSSYEMGSAPTMSSDREQSQGGRGSRG